MRTRLAWFAMLYLAGVAVTVGVAEVLRLVLVP